MITWDRIEARFYKAGVDHGVIYRHANGEYISGVAWNGLSEVSVSKTEHDKTFLYTNDRRSKILFSPFATDGSVKCIMFPPELEECFGYVERAPGMIITDQEDLQFGLCYRMLIGSHGKGLDAGYELHLLYGCSVTDIKLPPSSTINNSGSVSTFEISFTTIPEESEFSDSVAHIVIDSRRVTAEKLSALEGILYSEARLPLPNEVYSLLYTPVNPEGNSGYPSEITYPSDTTFPIDQGE